MSLRRRLLALVLLVGTMACTTRADDLRRAQAAFREARYEDVEIWLFDLEPEIGRMDLAQRAIYYYLAGMSAYRMGHRARARHALALCREESEQLGMHEQLPEQWQHNMNVALSELEREPRR